MEGTEGRKNHMAIKYKLNRITVNKKDQPKQNRLNVNAIEKHIVTCIVIAPVAMFLSTFNNEHLDF